MTTPQFFGSDAIRTAVGFQDVIEQVSAVLVDFSRELGESVVALDGPESDVQIEATWLPGRSIFTVRVAAWFLEGQRGGGTPGSGILAVFDAETGDLRALLEDEHHLSDIGTAAAGALAARTLARPDAAVLGVLGTGVQAYLQVLAAAGELPIAEVRLWGRDQDHATRLAAALLVRRPDLRVSAVAEPQDACENVDVLVTATASTASLVRGEWVAPGLHITSVGAAVPGKVELSAGCLRRADRVVVDSIALASVHGSFARAGAVPAALAELGEVLSGAVAGRTNDREVTICALVGPGVQDLAAAEVTLDLLRAGARRRTRPPASAKDLR